MTWKYYFSTSNEIHIDHIRPCVSFDLTKESEKDICFHYTNLQLLWREDNLEKHDKLNWIHPRDRET